MSWSATCGARIAHGPYKRSPPGGAAADEDQRDEPAVDVVAGGAVGMKEPATEAVLLRPQVLKVDLSFE